MFLFLCSSFWAQTDTTSIHHHLTVITKTPQYRNYKNLDQLNAVADYLFEEFSKHCDSVYFQHYEVNGQVYKNVNAFFGDPKAERIVLGAHYDVYGDQEGADDNATGVVGLLELAKMFKGKNYQYGIELVAYTLEEPPFFKTEFMGSNIHAQSLQDNDVEVKGMLSLEMLGYFKDEKNSQEYPAGILSWIYGTKGDYITLVKKFGSGKFARQFSRAFKSSKTIRTKSFKGPRWISGVDFSDHLNYWDRNMSALMITDTAFMRNFHYHQKSDTMDKLDLERMAKVIDGIYFAINKISKP